MSEKAGEDVSENPDVVLRQAHHLSTYTRPYGTRDRNLGPSVVRIGETYSPAQHHYMALCTHPFTSWFGFPKPISAIVRHFTSCE
jgi:hypothetical protein